MWFLVKQGLYVKGEAMGEVFFCFFFSLFYFSPWQAAGLLCVQWHWQLILFSSQCSNEPRKIIIISLLNYGLSSVCTYLGNIKVWSNKYHFKVFERKSMPSNTDREFCQGYASLFQCIEWFLLLFLHLLIFWRKCSTYENVPILCYHHVSALCQSY